MIGKRRRVLFAVIMCAAVALTFSVPAGGWAKAEVYAKSGENNTSAKVSAQTAAEAEAKLPKGRYVIRPLVSDTRVVTVKNGSKKSGANIYLYTGDMAKNQLFDLSYDAKGRARLKNVKSGKYISVSGKKAKKGANVVQASKSSSASQRWMLEAAGTSHGQPVFRVRSTLSTKYYLQLAGGKNRNASNIRLWKKNKSKAEKFVFIKADAVAEPAAEPTIADGVYRVGNALSSSLALATPDSSVKNGAVPALASKSSALSQLFIFTYEKGYYKVRSLVSGKSLTVRDGSVLAKAGVEQQDDKSKSNQRFKIVKKSGGTYQFIAKAGGLALRVASGQAKSGSALETYYPSGANSQKFTLTRVADIKLSAGVFSLSPYGKAELNLSAAASGASGGASLSFFKDDRSFAQKFLVSQEADGAYAIESVDSQLLLTASGSNVTQSPAPSGGPSDGQLWYVDLAVGGVKFLSKSTGKALQLTGGSGGFGVKLASPSESTDQAFLPVKVGMFDAGLYRVDSRAGAGSLEVEGASFFKLANIQADEADGSGTQSWFVRANADGSVTVRNERSGKPAEADGSRAGANVRQNKSTGGNAQKWLLEESGEGWYRLRSASGAGYMEANAANVGATGEVNVGTAAGNAGAGTGADTPDSMEWRFVPVELEQAGPAMPKEAADAVELEARKHLGKKYVFGAEGPKTFDCSGYIYYVMNQSGVREMSRVTAQHIYDSCVEIPASEAKRGDLIFFKNTYKTDRIVTHLGVYLGNGTMIHAGSPVQVSKVNTKYFQEHFYAYARLA
jgi:cell wall-associated NlpC family hydrolase